MSNAFDPNGVGIPNGQYFGFPYSYAEAEIVLLPIPWDVTTSYGAGTADGPSAILDASVQLDFHDFQVPNAWNTKIHSLEMDQEVYEVGQQLREQAATIIDYLEQGGPADDPELIEAQENINEQCAELMRMVETRCTQLLADGKIPGLVGGDHSTPLGLLRALAQKHEQFGVLQIDAHADLRPAYEGFTYSHASIMYNAWPLDSITQLTQVGIRDICPQELDLATNTPGIDLFSDQDLQSALLEGETWAAQCERIVATLPELVYISFDIDGLDPSLCPHTGTPVPGGMSMAQVNYLLQQIITSGRRIIGFDLVEVAPGAGTEWDANVGARMLYKLCQITHASQANA